MSIYMKSETATTEPSCPRCGNLLTVESDHYLGDNFHTVKASCVVCEDSFIIRERFSSSG